MAKFCWECPSLRHDQRSNKSIVALHRHPKCHEYQEEDQQSLMLQKGWEGGSLIKGVFRTDNQLYDAFGGSFCSMWDGEKRDLETNL